MPSLKPSHVAINNPNNLSTFTQKRGGKKSTFINSISRSILKFDHVEQSLQILRISLRKQSQRRNKLKKLLDKYSQIYAQDKKHVKQIKSSIIEMKDATSTCKLKILVDPTILVQNSIKVQTRQFLCALMNTFYRTYEQNQKNNQTIVSLNNTMSFLIKGISFNQDMIFLMQKTQMNEQVQLEGELLAEKNKMKGEALRKKQITEQYQSIKRVYDDARQRFLKKKQIIAQLDNHLRQLNEQQSSMKKNIQFQNRLKSQCQGKIDIQMLYHEKLAKEYTKIQQEAQLSNKQSKRLVKKLIDYKCKAQQAQLRKSGCSAILGQQSKLTIQSALISQLKGLR